MKSIKQKLLVLLLFLCLPPLFGQTFSTGAILDPVRYEQTEAKPVLVTRNYTSLPRTFSLKQYSPVPESQQGGTCTAWATAFAARTISESRILNRTNQTQTSNSAFSAAHVYIGSSNDPTFQRGMYIGDALEFMKNTGAVKRLPTERTMDIRTILMSMYNNSTRYPISGYVRLFSNYWGGPGTIQDRVIPVKKSLSEGKPVIIAMKTPASFHNSNMNIWHPTENPHSEIRDAHAMCVVGYNDDLHGGAFEVQNSWGTSWGNNGYIWIRYQDFANFVYEAYEIIESLTATQYAASIQIEVFNDLRGMPVTFDRKGFYRTRFSYPEGTLFQFQMTNRHPAYVYAFSADSSSTSPIVRVFPGDGVSPVLDYIDSTVAWPGENTGMILAGSADTHYLVVLYSRQALDIEAIERRFASERGTFPERVARAIGANFVPFNNVQYNTERIEFSAFSVNPMSVFGLLLAIDHR